MSLIAFTRRLRAGRSTLRTVLLAVAVAGGVIVGLLAMHSLNMHTAVAAPAQMSAAPGAAHGSAPVSSDATGMAPSADVTFMATSVGEAYAAAGGGGHHGEPTSDPSCPDCAGDHSGLLGIACVLGLLVALLVLGAPGLAARLLPPDTRVYGSLSAFAPRPHVHPPSLTVLCISRT